MNNDLIEDLYNKIDNLEKINQNQALKIISLENQLDFITEQNNYIDKLESEIARLEEDLKDACYVIEKIKKEKQQAIEYIKEKMETTYKINGYWTNELVNGKRILEILGDKE